MPRAMEGDTAVDILTYLPTGEVVSAILMARAWYNKARDIQKSRKRYGQMSKVRIQKCINVLHETKSSPGCYEDIVVANKTYKVGTSVRMIDDSRD